MPDTDTQSLAEFIAEHGITYAVKRATTNPHMADDQWARTAQHWRVTLYCEGRTWTVPFSQGSAHTEAPTAADVLDCVASDIAMFRGARSVEEWMAYLGYEDRDAARRTFDQIHRQDNRLQELLRDGDAVEALLYKTERL